jgi:hypothetical protein
VNTRSVSNVFLYVGMVGQDRADEYMNPIDWECSVLGVRIICRSDSDGNPTHAIHIAPHAWKYIEVTDTARGVDE